MVQRMIASHSLRHLRFARRVTGVQPRVARAYDVTPVAKPVAASSTILGSHGSNPATVYTSPDGRQLPLASVLRHLPERGLTPEDDAHAAGTGNTPVVEATPQSARAEPVLRLLPRLPASESPVNDDATAHAVTDAQTQQPGFSSPASDVTQTPDALKTTPARSGVPPARVRSRIVELPGVVASPLADASPSSVKPKSELENVAPEPRPANAIASVEPPIPADEDKGPLAGQAHSGDQPTPDLTSAAPTSADAPPASETRAAPRRRSGKQAATPSPRAADALFLPTDADRSAQAWLARLQRAAQPAPEEPAENPPIARPHVEPPPAPRRRGARRQSSAGTSAASMEGTSAQPSQPPVPSAEPPSALPATSRVLLHALTGVDPEDTPIFRGPVAERATADQNADAMTDGSVIALGAGHTSDTPETLGLLAHELTHIAHRRNPRFVPPVIRSPQGRGSSPDLAPLPRFSAVTSYMDEEAEARHVEAAVRDVASKHAQPAVVAHTPITGQPRTMPDPAATQPERKATQLIDTPSAWGNLPAPWEPLPEWLAAPSAQSEPQQPSPSAPRATSAPDSAPSQTSSDTNSGVQRAERGRTLPAVESESPQWHEERKPEPDLDALAQQIHAILKRRLAAERRRFG